MAELSRAALEAFFETNDKPTQAQFAAFIESCINIVDDGILGWQKTSLRYTAWQPDPTDDGFVVAFNVPAGYIASYVVAIPSTKFIGGPINKVDFTIKAWDQSTTMVYFLLDLFPAITNNTGGASPITFFYFFGIPDIVLGNDLLAYIKVYGVAASIDHLTQGEIDIYYLLNKIF